MIVFRCIIFMLFASVHQCRLPDKVFCVNDQCSEPISKAKTILNYNSGDPDLMSFRSNSEATIFMKSAGTNADLWFASINGHSGFVSSNFLRENKIYVKNPQVIKPVEDRRTPPPNVEPNKVQQTHEVIEGTTIYTTEATPSIPPQETLPEVSQQSVNENATPSLDTLNQENITPQPHAIGTVETPYEISQNIETQVNNVNEQRNIQNQLPVVHRQEVAANNIENQQVPPPQKMVTNNEVKSVEAPTQIIQQESPPQKAINNNVDQAQFNEGPKLEIVQPPPALLPTSGNSVSPVTTVDVSDKANFIPESATQPEAPENEHNISANNIENQQVPPPQKMVTNNEVKSVEAPTQIIQQESPPQEAININVDQAQFNEGPKLEIVPPPPALLPTSGNSMNPVTTVDVSDKANLIPESATQPEAPENEQNISFISNNNVENTAANDISSETNQVPEINVVASNKQPDVAPPLDQVPDLLQHDNGEASTTLSVEHPPESVDEEYTVQPEILQEDLKDDEYTTQILDYPSTTEPPVTTQYDYDTTTQSVYYNSEETTPAPNEISSANQYEIYEHTTTYEPMRETINTFSSTESPTEQLQYESTASKEATNPTTESTPDENTGGFFSNIYSTVSDMWPSATEGPPTVDDIFNREKYSEPLLKEDLDTILDSIKEPENPNHIYHSDTKEPQENEVPVKNVESEEEFSFLTYFTSVFVSVLGNGEESRALFATPGETCYTNESPHEGKEQNRRLLTFLMTTAGALLLFTLGYYYIDAKRQDSKFVGMVNSLQRELLCATKECEILKEELTTTKTKLAGIEDNSFGMDDMVQSLKEEIQELLAQNERLRNSLDDNEKLLRVSENTAGELQNTLGEVENTLSELWAERAQSEEQIAELNGKIQAFEEELISVSRDRDHFQLKYVSAETALEEAKKQAGKLDELGQKLADANNTVELQKHEITALKDALKEFNQGSFNVDVSSLIDHTEIKAKLAKASEERNALELKFKTEYKERTRLQEELQSTQETLHTTSQQANEAATRLEVLEKYFQERESELVKELNTKESLWLSKQGESASTVQKIELLQQEMQRYKEKCDALTLELAEQESAKRTAVAELEARAHSAWLEARAAKRDAAADREAAAALRRKLASLAPDGKPETQRIASPLEAAMPNGSGAALPLPLPLPLAFLPPPPLLPPLPRPPPLGGLPSPHPPRFSDRYSPDSRYSPESRYSPDSRYSQEPLRRRDSPDSRYSPERRRRSPAFSPRTHRRRTPSRERYPHPQERSSRQRNGPMMDTETEYGSDSPTRSPPRRRHSYRHSGPSSGSGCSSESDK